MSTLSAKIDLSPARIVRRARGLLGRPGAATTGCYFGYRDLYGEVADNVGPENANCYCLVGALARAYNVVVEAVEYPDELRYKSPAGMHAAISMLYAQAKVMGLSGARSLLRRNLVEIWDDTYAENPDDAFDWLARTQYALEHAEPVA